MEIELWKDFSKRYNSTKVPADAGEKKNVRLKEDTSIDAPSFILNSTDFTYSYIKAFGNYYFVTQIIALTNTQSEIRCEKDVLATYKSNILSSSAYVLYHTHANSELSDKRLGVKTTKSISSNSGSFDLLGNVSIPNCACVLSITGEDSIGSYGIGQDSANVLLNNFDNWFDDDLVFPDPPDKPHPESFWESVADWIKFVGLTCGYIGDVVITAMSSIIYLGKQFIGTGVAPDKIRSAVLLPIPTSALIGNSEEIHLGKYDTQIDGIRITNRIFADGVVINIPWQATDWRRNAPYHELYLYIPYIGVVEVSPSDVVGDSTIQVSVVLDTITGDAIFTVRTENSHVIGQYTTNLATSFPIGNSNITTAGAITTLATLGVSVGATIATGGASAILPATAGIVGIANQLSSQGSTIGSNSGGASLGLSSDVIMYSIFHDTITAPNTVSNSIGTPTNCVMLLSSINGYVQTSGISVECSAESPEKQKINSMIDSGIYIE